MSNLEADLQALRKLNKRFIHNFVTNDVRSHNAMLHPAFTNITPKGAHVDRLSYLRQWANGFDPATMVYWDMRDERISVLGDVALVRATNRWVHRQDGQDTVGMTCYTDTYVRSGQTWLCVQAQLTPVAPQNYPSDAGVVVRYLDGKLQN
jgi:Domain of unknown function (DUF4440)